MDKPKLGMELRGFRLIEDMGGGGNGEVWKATKDGKKIAIKFLRSKKVHDPIRLERFRREVEFLAANSARKGILPILDCSVPTDPAELAWFSMPVAKPAAEKLGNGSDLDLVVRAILDYSKTLAEMHRDGQAHRDIKPDNLFWHQGAWVLGDFGLVSTVEHSALTAENTRLGPLYFLAPEMMLSPHKADGRAADVYSLSKTLWALASGQKYPPPGTLDVSTSLLRLSTWITHPRSAELESLLEQGTAANPNHRPKMEQFSDALEEWLIPIEARIEMKPGADMFSAVAAHLAPSKREAARFHENYEAAMAIVVSFIPLLEQIADMYRPAFSAVNHMRGLGPLSEVLSQFGVPEIEDKTNLVHSSDNVSASSTRGEFSAHSGVAMWSTQDGTIHLAAGHVFHDGDTGKFESVWYGYEKFLLGGPGQKAGVERLRNGLVENFPKVAERSAEAVKKRTQ